MSEIQTDHVATPTVADSVATPTVAASGVATPMVADSVATPMVAASDVATLMVADGVATPMVATPSVTVSHDPSTQRSTFRIHQDVRDISTATQRRKIIALLDVSGSMSTVRQKLEVVIKTLFKSLPSKHDRMAVVTFSEQADVVVPYKTQEEFDPETFKLVIDSRTFVSPGLDEVRRIIEADPPESGEYQCVFLLTDGVFDDAEKEASEAIQWFANPGKEVKQKTIPVYCMGVGDSFDASVIEYFGRMTRACCAPKIQSDDFIQTSNESVSAVLDKGVCAIVSDQVCATFILSADAFEKGARFYKPNETDITSNLDRIEDVLFVEDTTDIVYKDEPLQRYFTVEVPEGKFAPDDIVAYVDIALYKCGELVHKCPRLDVPIGAPRDDSITARRACWWFDRNAVRALVDAPEVARKILRAHHSQIDNDSAVMLRGVSSARAHTPCWRAFNSNTSTRTKRMRTLDSDTPDSRPVLASMTAYTPSAFKHPRTSR